MNNAKLFFCTCIVALGVLFNFKLTSYNTNDILNLNLENVEALAQNERENCYYTSSSTCTSTWQESYPVGDGTRDVWQFTETETVCNGYLRGYVCCTPNYNFDLDYIGTK